MNWLKDALHAVESLLFNRLSGNWSSADQAADRCLIIPACHLFLTQLQTGFLCTLGWKETLQRVCITDSPGELGLVSRGSKGPRSPLALAGHKRRIPLAVVLPRPARGAGTLIPSAQRLVWAAKRLTTFHSAD